MQAVRAEIKKWEKSFKAQNARDPTVDDIKAHLDIANKYRLYKRLSKQAAATAPQPSTPPRAPVLLPSTSRVAETTAPLAIFNPFSPVKSKGKKRADPVSPPPSAILKPFSTPSRSISKRALSISPREPSVSTQPDALLSPVAPTSALSRARKRLRGEPVSPSPDKGKRQRILSHSNPPIPSLNLSDIDAGPVHTNIDKSGSSTIIGDSPVKPPAGSKSFTTLFQETLPPLILEPKTDGGAITQAPDSIPNHKPVNILPSFDEELSWLKSNRAVKGKGKQHPVPQKFQKATKTVDTSAVRPEQGSRVPLKRPLSDTEPDSTDIHSRIEAPPVHTLPLLPPSPPPNKSSVVPSTSKLRQKSNSIMNARKKSKISNVNTSGEESSEETDDTAWPKIRVIDATSRRPQLTHQGDDSWDENLESDPDPLLADVFRSKGQGSPHGLHPLRGVSPIPTSDAESKGSLEVDLPDKLRDVLDLDMLGTRTRDRHEERVVESLLYNRRTIHYDGNKGGEIWGVGEDSHLARVGWDGELEVQPITDGEEDWEGEPVAWDVAEL